MGPPGLPARPRQCALAKEPCTFVEFIDVIGPFVDPVAHGGNASDVPDAAEGQLRPVDCSQAAARRGDARATQAS